MGAAACSDGWIQLLVLVLVTYLNTHATSTPVRVGQERGRGGLRGQGTLVNTSHTPESCPSTPGRHPDAVKPHPAATSKRVLKKDSRAFTRGRYPESALPDRPTEDCSGK
eukprot:260361-Chlamydomonas_euryale.AAC.2